MTTTVSPAPAASTRKDRRLPGKQFKGPPRISAAGATPRRRALRRLYDYHRAGIGERLGAHIQPSEQGAQMVEAGNGIKSHNAGCFKPGAGPWNKGALHRWQPQRRTTLQRGDKPHVEPGRAWARRRKATFSAGPDTGVTRRDATGPVFRPGLAGSQQVPRQDMRWSFATATSTLRSITWNWSRAATSCAATASTTTARRSPPPPCNSRGAIIRRINRRMK